MDQSSKRRAQAARKMQDIKTFKTNMGRGGAAAGTEHTHVPSGEAPHLPAAEPPKGFTTWHEFYNPKK